MQVRKRSLPSGRPMLSAAHMPQHRREMMLVHGNGAEPALPEKAGAFAPGPGDASMVGVRTRKRATPPVWIGRYENQMHMVRHPAPRARTSTPAAPRLSASRSQSSASSKKLLARLLPRWMIWRG
jgi:hypothetical protein